MGFFANRSNKIIEKEIENASFSGKLHETSEYQRLEFAYIRSKYPEVHSTFQAHHTKFGF